MKTTNSSFSIIGFLLFFSTIMLTSTASIFVYYFATKWTNGSQLVVVVSVLITIILGALICTFIDVWRRKIMIDKPVKLILEATDKIASGNFDVKLYPLHDFDKYTRYDVIFENINIMSAELAKDEILKKDFISNVSHEIKTPLAIIQNYAKTLENSTLPDVQKNEIITGIIMQTQRLSNLISSILKLNKLENQELIPENKHFDLSELLRTTILRYETLIENKSLELICDIDDVMITGSESLIEIVLNNLISNAIKFTDKGFISISLKNEEDTVLIKVQDSGCGISNDIGKHIFDKFYQGDTSHSSEGNGLGLALVKKVIDLIGGEITVESKVNFGSTFTLKIKKV
ncbi:MAG: HAMP domain-containing histidine kinase [Clostridia bacterium]|nr:HAMP domain-containing histidine kinase [Clostridia bacterium]